MYVIVRVMCVFLFAFCNYVNARWIWGIFMQIFPETPACTVCTLWNQESGICGEKETTTHILLTCKECQTFWEIMKILIYN